MKKKLIIVGIISGLLMVGSIGGISTLINNNKDNSIIKSCIEKQKTVEAYVEKHEEMQQERKDSYEKKKELLEEQFESNKENSEKEISEKRAEIDQKEKDFFSEHSK